MDIEQVRTTLKSIIEWEYEEEVILLEETEDTRKTVRVTMFVELFAEAELTYESLTQEKYKPLNYKQFFDVWKEKGLIS